MNQNQSFSKENHSFSHFIKNSYSLLKKRIRGIFRGTMAEDPNKIITQQNWLNSLISGQTWVAVQGYHSLTSATVDTSITFYPTSGYIVKIFVNTTTGEIRMFPYQIFERNP